MYFAIISMYLMSLIYATDFLNQPENSGFSQVHTLGFKGKGTCIAFIEENHTYHPDKVPLLDERITKLFDHSRNFNPQPGFEDHSSSRYTSDNCKELNDIKNSLTGKNNRCGHDIQVMSMSLGHKTEIFQGGASPDARGVQYNFSIICPSLYSYNFRVAGTNNHTLKELAEYSNKFAKTEINTEELSNDRVVDNSFLNALLAAIKNKDVGVINISQCFTQLIDFSEEKPKISEKVISILKEALEKNPKPIVFAAGNYPPSSFSFYKNEEEEYERWQKYSIKDYSATVRYLTGVVLNGLANDPEISKYLLIACNVQKTNNGYELHETSNYPQKNPWGKSAVCAIGGLSIRFDEKTKSNGTSLSAPTVASLVCLMKEANPNLTAYEIVENIKNNCLSLGDKEKFGYGLINPLKTIESILPEDYIASCRLI